MRSDTAVGCAMSKIRIRFEKTGSMKYIGHLDCMRFFQKLMRLADIDIRYSEGFSPHPIMSFASPLGVGIESRGEYVDIEVNRREASRDALARLNRSMPEGLAVLSFRELPEDAKNAMSLITCADYRVVPKSGIEVSVTQAVVEELFHRANTFPVVKKTKKSERTLDLKEYVYQFRYDRDGFFIRLSAGSETNIKPELLLAAFFERAGLPFSPLDWQIRRLDLYAGDPLTGFRSLESYGTEIDIAE